MIIGTVKEIWRHPVKSMAGERLATCSVGSLGIPGDRGWALRDEKAKEITNGKRVPLLMHCAARYRNEPDDGNIPHVDIVLPDGAMIGSDNPEVNSRLSEALGRTLTLWPRQPATNKEHYRRGSTAARVMGRLSSLPAFRALLPQLSKLPNIDGQLRQAFSREAGEPVPDISVLPPEVLEFTSPLGTYFDAFPIHVLTSASLATMAKINPQAVWDVRRFRPNFYIETAATVSGLPESDWSGRTLRVGTVELKCEIPTARCGMTTHSQKNLPKDPSVLRSIVKDADQNLGVYASVTRAGQVREGDSVQLL
jgi:uncharacterized protein